MSWNGGRDAKKNPMPGDVVSDGGNVLRVDTIMGDYVCLAKCHVKDFGNWTLMHAHIKQWRDECRRSSVKVLISNFL